MKKVDNVKYSPIKMGLSKSWPISLNCISTPLSKENNLFEFGKIHQNEVTQFTFQDHVHIYRETRTIIVKLNFFEIFIPFEVH